VSTKKNTKKRHVLPVLGEYESISGLALENASKANVSKNGKLLMLEQVIAVKKDSKHML